MPWWLMLLFLGVAVLLWLWSLRQRDDVIALFVKFLSVMVALVVVLVGRPLLLELSLLALAAYLPSALRCERQGGWGAKL